MMNLIQLFYLPQEQSTLLTSCNLWLKNIFVEQTHLKSSCYQWNRWCERKNGSSIDATPKWKHRTKIKKCRIRWPTPINLFECICVVNTFMQNKSLNKPKEMWNNLRKGWLQTGRAERKRLCRDSQASLMFCKQKLLHWDQVGFCIVIVVLYFISIIDLPFRNSATFFPTSSSSSCSSSFKIIHNPNNSWGKS